MPKSPQSTKADEKPYNARADKSGLLIGGIVCIVIVLPILIHFGKMAAGVAN